MGCMPPLVGCQPTQGRSDGGNRGPGGELGDDRGREALVQCPVDERLYSQSSKVDMSKPRPEAPPLRLRKGARAFVLAVQIPRQREAGARMPNFVQRVLLGTSDERLGCSEREQIECQVRECGHGRMLRSAVFAPSLCNALSIAHLVDGTFRRIEPPNTRSNLGQQQATKCPQLAAAGKPAGR